MVLKQDDFTEQAQEALSASQQLVVQMRHSQWDAEHLLSGLLQIDNSLSAKILLSLIHISEPTRLGMISYAVFC